MEEKTIEEIFDDIKDVSIIEVLKQKLGESRKNSSGNLEYFPNSKFKKYLECKSKFKALENDLETLKLKVNNGDINAMTKTNFSGHLNSKKIESALQYWVFIGYKKEIEKIIEEALK